MKKLLLLLILSFMVFSLSCAATKRMERRDRRSKVPESAEQADKREVAKSDEEKLFKKFAKLVTDTEKEIKGEDGKADHKKFEEFYGTPFEKNAMLLQAASIEYGGDLESALAAYRKLIERYPDSADGFAGMVHVLLEQNDIRAAGEVEEKVEITALKGESSRLFNELASLSILKRNAGSAEKYLTLAKKRNLNLDTYLYNSAIVRLIEGNRKESAQLLAMTSSTFKKTSYYGLLSSEVKGTIYRKDQERGMVSKKLQSGIINYSAIMALANNDMEEAEVILIRAVEDRTGSAETHILLGNVSFEKGFFKDAAEHYQKGIELNPFIPEAHLNLGIVSEVYLEDYSRAKSSYSTYLELGGQNQERVEKWLKNIELWERAK